MLATMYSSGMRVSEVVYLHYDDISRTNMQIHVRGIKNRMDRFTILSKKDLDLLTEYWFKKGRPMGMPEVLEHLYGIKVCVCRKCGGYLEKPQMQIPRRC